MNFESKLNMKFIFIDESERQRSFGSKDQFFSLTGLIIDSNDLINLENELEDFKTELALGSLKELRRTNKISPDEKLIVTKKLNNLLKQYNVKLISVILEYPEKKCSITSITKNYILAISFMIERFYMHMKKEKTDGLVIHDSLSNFKLEKSVKEEYNKKILTDNMFGDKSKPFKKRIYPVLFFANDFHSVVLQISDLISSSMNNAYYNFIKNSKDKDTNNIFKYSNYLEEYRELYEKNPKNGDVDGWGIKIWR